MEEEKTPKDAREENRRSTRQKIKRLLRDFKPEQAILIVGKHRPEGEGSGRYETRTLLSINLSVAEIFAKTMTIEIVKIKNLLIKKKKIITPGELGGGRRGLFLR